MKNIFNISMLLLGLVLLLIFSITSYVRMEVPMAGKSSTTIVDCAPQRIYLVSNNVSI